MKNQTLLDLLGFVREKLTEATDKRDAQAIANYLSLIQILSEQMMIDSFKKGYDSHGITDRVESFEGTQNILINDLNSINAQICAINDRLTALEP